MIHNSSNRRNVKNWLEENGDVMSVVVVMLVLGFMVVAVYVLAGSGRLGASVGVAVSSCVGLVGLMLMPSDGTTGKTPVGDQTADGQGGGGLAGVIEGLIEGLTGEPVKKDAPTPAPPAAPGPSVDWGLVGNITLGIIGALIGIALLLLIAARLRRLAAVRRAARLVAAEKARIEAEAAAKDIILWNERRTLEGELWDRFKQYEINPRLRITRPFMVDLSEPLLQAATTAMLNARALNTPTPPAFDRAVTDVTQTPYYRAVGTFDMALRAAEDKAAKVG